VPLSVFFQAGSHVQKEKRKEKKKNNNEKTAHEAVD